MLRKTQLRRVSEKQKIKIESKKNLIQEDHKLYMEIWEERPHLCYENGCRLAENPPPTTYFHHVLPKEKFSQYRHEKWNIILLSPTVHSNIEFGGMSKAPKVKKLYLELLEKHYNFAENQ